MIHHYELEDKDFGKLATRLKEIAIVEMKHAEKLAERILFLKGKPTLKPDILPNKGQTIQELLATDVALEAKAIRMYNEAAAICASEKDHKSKDLFEELIADEEEHLNIFENIKDHVDQMGGGLYCHSYGLEIRLLDFLVVSCRFKPEYKTRKRVQNARSQRWMCSSS